MEDDFRIVDSLIKFRSGLEKYYRGIDESYKVHLDFIGNKKHPQMDFYLENGLYPIKQSGEQVMKPCDYATVSLVVDAEAINYVAFASTTTVNGGHNWQVDLYNAELVDSAIRKFAKKYGPGLTKSSRNAGIKLFLVSYFDMYASHIQATWDGSFQKVFNVFNYFVEDFGNDELEISWLNEIVLIVEQYQDVIDNSTFDKQDAKNLYKDLEDILFSNEEARYCFGSKIRFLMEEN